MRAARPWLALLVLALSPWVLLAALGGWWLWQNGQILHWLWLAMAASGMAWLLGRFLQQRQSAPFAQLPLFAPDRLNSPAAEAAWAKVEAMADALNPADYPLDQPGKLFGLAQRILAAVARQFRPQAQRAELDAPLPSILLIIERVSRDMRELLTEQVPASHLITVEDGLTLWRWKETLEQLGTLAGVGRMAVNPLGGVLYELRMVFFNRATHYPLAQLERWLLHTLARKIGYYGILLYSGQLRLDDAAERASAASQQDLQRADEAANRPAEPLRILVAGQTKAGKSSLINALFGELRAPADALPLTGGVTPYRLERDGEFLGLVFDSPGYGELVSWIDAAPADLHNIDLLLLACSATHAGRAADVRFLEALRARYAKIPERIAPPLLVALTHIDQLRPAREWAPPYNLAEPVGAKESQIRLCLEEVARTLVLPLEQVQAVCLNPGDEWNIEAVWAAIAAQLPEARRARYLRCLKDAQAREKWELILRQLGNAGRLVASSIGKILAKK